MLRYTPRRKAEIVAIALKEPSKVEDLLKQHGISPEELSTWCDRLIHQGGRQALRATRVQDFRRVAHA